MERGLLIHPDELSEAWADRLCASSLKRFGLHPVGGRNANASMADLIARRDGLAPLLTRLEAAGLTVEHEMHALRYLFPAALFTSHPDWFRMNEKGVRTPDFNLCPSSRDALDFLSARAEEAARLLPARSHRYHFWTDDVGSGVCCCPYCRALSPSDQMLTITNAILRGLRRADPSAKLCFLAYHQTLPAPRKVTPEDGVFLEFAPMGRDYHRPLNDPSCAQNAAIAASLPDLFACFGRTDAMALDYWLDNSLYSRWTKPPKPFVWDRAVTEADLDFYASCGFSAATTFACYLGPDYEEVNGGFPDISAYLNG